MRTCDTCKGSILQGCDRSHSCVAVFAARAQHVREALDLALERLEALTHEHEELRACAALVLSRLGPRRHAMHEHSPLGLAVDALAKLVNT